MTLRSFVSVVSGRTIQSSSRPKRNLECETWSQQTSLCSKVSSPTLGPRVTYQLEGVYLLFDSHLEDVRVEPLASVLEDLNGLLAFEVERLQLWAVAWRGGTRSALDRGQSRYIVVVQHRNQAVDGVEVENCDQPAVSGKVSKGRCQRKT